jgi:RNA polymerase sigma factor (sigma-70 family)
MAEIIFKDSKKEYTYDEAVKVAMDAIYHGSRKWKSTMPDEEFEDLASIGYLSIPRAIATFDGRGRFDAWCRFIADQQIAWEWKKKQAKKIIPANMMINFTDLTATPDNEGEDDPLDVEEVFADPRWNAYERIEDRDELAHALANIEDTRYVAYHLARTQGYSVAELKEAGYSPSFLNRLESKETARKIRKKFGREE